MTKPSLPRFADAAAVIAALRPEAPVYCVRPHALRAAARAFLNGFPGDVLYAVKCNPEPPFLEALHDAGIRHFDTASLAEIALIGARFPEAHVYFMHPVKRRAAIRDAYYRHGVRHYAVDHPDELDKVRAETGGAPDVVVVVRLATARGAALYDLGGKFGCSVEEAAGLLRRAVDGGRRVGLSFHVGSQCLAPGSWTAALGLVGETLARAPVALDVLDVGGGFPAAYVGIDPPPLDAYFQAIRAGVAALNLPAGCALWCEPGRALVAAGASLLVRVELRRDFQLHINDGVFGSLSDLKSGGVEFPMRALRLQGAFSDRRVGFTLFGPTCDPADAMPGPYRLPADLREGDYIEIGQAGAYTTVFRTGFNGFYPNDFVEVAAV